MQSRSRLWRIVVVAPIAATIALDAAAQDVLPRKVAEALRENADALSPVSVEWILERGSDRRHAALLQQLKRSPGDLSFFAPHRTHYVYSDGMTYAHITLPSPELDAKTGAPLDGGAIQYSESEAAFNGEKMFGSTANPEAEGPVLSVNTPASFAAVSGTRAFTVPRYFLDAGFKLPSNAIEFGATPRARSHVLVLAEQTPGATKAEETDLEGADCLKVSIADQERLYEFYLDPAMHYAVRRRDERLPSGALALRTRCSGFSQVAGKELWLPRTCETEVYTHASMGGRVTEAPLFIERIKVEKLRNAPVDEDLFSLDRKYTHAGTAVLDRTLSSKDADVRYVIPADPDELDRVVESALKGETYIRSRRGWWLWLIGFNFVLFALIVGYAVWRGHARARG